MTHFGKVLTVVVLLSAALAASQLASAGDVFNMNPGLTSLEMVTIGNPGNPDDVHYDYFDGWTYFGAVDYEYQIGTYEVTAAQYTVFLNAVAATDTYGLYNESMQTNTHGCQIVRSGPAGSYTYSVAVDYANRPVNYIGWGDTVRFANWLHNGQPTGQQALNTTEDGSYLLYGANTDAELMAITRKGNADWVLPSEDEWYKAAYHKNAEASYYNGYYYETPGSTDDSMSNDLLDPDPGNNANFPDPSYVLGEPYYRTEVGEFENSPSPYGTFDQGGNLREWSEGIVDDYGSPMRSLRGGAYGYIGAETGYAWRSDVRQWGNPSYEDRYNGFRVANVVPEPLTLGLLGLGASAFFVRRRKS